MFALLVCGFGAVFGGPFAAHADGVERQLVISTSRAPYEGQAVDALTLAFLGPGARSNRAISFPDGAPGDQLNAGSGLHVGLRFAVPLSQDGRWWSNLEVAYDRQSHEALFLGDTYTLTLQGVMAEAGLERRGSWSLGRKDLQTRLALGVSLSRFEASLTSSLLSVQVAEWAQDAYLRGGLSVPLLGPEGPGGMAFEAELTGHMSGGYDLTFGMALTF